MQGEGDHPGSTGADPINGSGPSAASQVSEDDGGSVDTLYVSRWRSIPDRDSIPEDDDAEDSVVEAARATSEASSTSGKGSGKLKVVTNGAGHDRERRPSDVSRLSSTDFQDENTDKVMELITAAAEARPHSQMARRPEHARPEHTHSHGDLRPEQADQSRRPGTTHARSLSPVARRGVSPERTPLQTTDEEGDGKDPNDEGEKPAPPQRPHNWKPHPWSMSWRQHHVSSMQALQAEQQSFKERKSSSSESEAEAEEEAESHEEEEEEEEGSSTRIFRNENLDHFRSQKGEAWKALLPPPAPSKDADADDDDDDIDKNISPTGSFIRQTVGAFSSSILRRFKSEDNMSPSGRMMSPQHSMEELSGMLTRTVSAAIGLSGPDHHQHREEKSTPKVSPFLQKYNFAGPQEIDNLLKGLGVECDVPEKDILLKAFICPVCDFANEACTTIADQIRAVFDAFRLIDADEDGLITLSELRDIASWTLDGEGNEFINNLIKMLRVSGGMGDLESDEEEDEILISAKDFLLAFARCLEPDSELGTIEEILEKRAVEYRKIGSLFGMEKVQQQFHWNKFLLTFFSDTLAVVAFPLCKILEYMSPDDPEPDVDSEEPPPPTRATLHDILTQSQWLPTPFNSFDSFQIYLMKLWVPSIFSVVCYTIFSSYMKHISVAEVLSPTIIYIIIGTYISTISGYEHPRMVLRRMNMSLSSQTKLNELQAIFAFRAHTPEGHMVDQIGSIADFLGARRFQWMSSSGSALAGLLHGLMPTVHRIWFAEDKLDGAESHTCSADEQGGLDATLRQIYFWLCGGHNWVHLLVSGPSAFISGYLTYRLLYITCVGFYNDLAFYNRLKLFRAMTQAEPFLRYRSRWLRGIKRAQYQGRKEFLQFLNLQKRDDLVLWCRIRKLMVESYAGFRTKQGDVMVTFMLMSVVVLTSYIFFFQMGRDHGAQMSVFDMRARADVFVFSLLLITIVNLKLSIHSLRKSDISLLHKEYYTASMSANSGASAMPTADLKPKPVPQAGSRFAASFVRRKSICSNESGGWVSPMQVRGNPSQLRSANGFHPSGEAPGAEDAPYGMQYTDSFGGSRSNFANSRKGSRRPSVVGGDAGGGGGGGGGGVPVVAASRRAEQGVQKLLEHTARYIAEFDRPPRLLSFTVSIHFLRYIFLPLLSPIIAALRVYTTGYNPHHHHHHHHHNATNVTNVTNITNATA